MRAILLLTLLSCIRPAVLCQQSVRDDTSPVNHKIYSASSSDGLNWTPDQKLILDRASAHSAIVTKEGAIRIYYVDGSKTPETTNCAESTDGGLTFSPLNLTITRQTGIKALDPSIVMLKDGRYRLYYFVETSPPSQPEGIYSAISTDGVNFTEEGKAFAYSNVVDADVYKVKKEWMMISVRPTGDDAVVSHSRDGVNFEYLKDLQLQGYRPSTPVALVPFKGGGKQFRMYALNTRTGNIESLISTNGVDFSVEPGTRLARVGDQRLSDPFVLKLPNGTWKMFYRLTQADSRNRYMALHACDTARTDCTDPRNHQVYLAESADGSQWTLAQGWKPYAGSVPDAIRRGNQLYVYSLPSTLVRYDLTTFTQSAPVNFTVSGASHIVDPSLAMDENGRFVMFYMQGQTGGDPASCLPGQTNCTKIFRSATEVEGSNGTSFTVDTGVRATVELNGLTTSKMASDPDIFSNSREYVMYISHGASTSAWTATELRGKFSKLQDLSNGTGGVACGYYDSTKNEYLTYAHVTRNGVAVIRMAKHKDLLHQLTESDWTTVLTGLSLGLTASYSVESPGLE